MTRIEARLVALDAIVRAVRNAIEGKAGLQRLLAQAALDAAYATNSLMVAQEVCTALNLDQEPETGESATQG